MLGHSPRSATIWASALVLSCFTSAVVGLRTSPGSPCEDVCYRTSTNTTSADIVCQDRLFSSTTKGSNFEQCVECQLDSDYVDEGSGESDVNWGLYNLRFTLTSCLFGYPEQVVNMSSPCVVSCQPLDSALEYDIKAPSALSFNTWCGTSSFADNVIDQCEFCYNLTTNQVYMANFLEALRFDCHFRTPTGTSFAISPARIFTQSLLPSTNPSTTASPDSGGVKNLPLVIALPILAFVIVVCGTTLCCFFFIRWRRKRARKQRQSSHLYARWNDTTISTPAHGWDSQYAPGLGFTDSDGREQHVGFAKPAYVEVSEPPLPVAHSPEEKKSPVGYFSAVPGQKQ